MNKIFLPLIFVTALATSAHADEGHNFIGGDAQAEHAENPAKAPREVNPFSTGNPMAKAMAAGFVSGLLGPVGLLGAISVPIIAKQEVSDLAKINAFYSGSVVRGRVNKIFPLGGSSTTAQFISEIKKSGIDTSTIPAAETIRDNLVALRLDVAGPVERIAVARIDAGYEVGDILDAKHVVNGPDHIAYNKEMPRVINTYCKHDNPVCQDDYDSSFGVLYRHTDTEFPPSQYLIDPAIIAADQAKMRKEEEDKKAAANNGGFSFM